jgi:hypothetical protein
MRVLSGIGIVLTLAFVGLALTNLWSVVLFRNDVALCIWAFASALGVSFGLYAVSLQSRITAVEKRLAERK